MNTKKGIIFLFLIYMIVNFIRAVEVESSGKCIIPDSTNESMKIDGDLKENIWAQQSLSQKFLTFYPTFGKPLDYSTEIWAAYDSKNLYFAFQCFDKEPGKLKTSISRRDTISSDDWIGIMIDTLGNKQSSYEFYVNPSGIQEDGITSAVDADAYDNSPDFVWESAGKITEKGYQVEVKIPLSSIRFKGKKEVIMNILFMRSISRLGKMGSWPYIKAGENQFNAMKNIKYKGLKKLLNLEVLPNLTYNRNDDRENENDWKTNHDKNIGISLKYGITSASTLEATISPDFSQVESDAFQVEVNQRYPIFYNEKRPFFMEGMNIFDFGIVRNGMMLSAVYTRNIADPRWAAKLSGSSGKMLYGFLGAGDKAPGLEWNEGGNPYLGKDAIWGIARLKYSLGGDNSIGVIYSGRHFAYGRNHVTGLDLQYRFLKNTRLSVSYLNSKTKEPEEIKFLNGNCINVLFDYYTSKLRFVASFESHDEDFKMYSAFINRSNISRGLLYISPNIYPKKGKWSSWLMRISPYARFIKLHDLETGMDDTTYCLGLNLFLTRNGFFKLEYLDEEEVWMGKLFNSKYIYSYINMQIFKWLNTYIYYKTGDRICYDTADPFLGIGKTNIFSLRIQPDKKLNLELQYIRDKLDRKLQEKKENIHKVNIYNFLATYQFNKYFFLRGACRYNDYQRKLLTDFLASFTLIPGTVMHLGYGSIYEGKKWNTNQWISGYEKLINTKNSFFLKISYLWQLN